VVNFLWHKMQVYVMVYSAGAGCGIVEDHVTTQRKADWLHSVGGHFRVLTFRVCCIFQQLFSKFDEFTGIVGKYCDAVTKGMFYSASRRRVPGLYPFCRN
jgi:hypothetical protein